MAWVAFQVSPASCGDRIIAIPPPVLAPLIAGSPGRDASGSADGGARAPAPATVPSARFDRFILGPAADLFFFGPGATIVVAGALLTLPLLGPAWSVAATTLTAMLTFLIVGPHYAATYRRAYTSLEIIRAHPIVTIAVPLVLGLAAFLAV